MKENGLSIAVPCVAVAEECSTESSALVPIGISDDYSIKSKVACSIWLEKKGYKSKRMLARFLR